MNKKELYKRICEKRWKQIRELKGGAFEAKGHFWHITGNAMCSYNWVDENANEWKSNPSRPHHVLGLLAIRKYLGLLSKYSDFRNKELTVQIGAFPEIPSGGTWNYGNYRIGGSIYYIFKAAERLENKVVPT